MKRSRFVVVVAILLNGCGIGSGNDGGSRSSASDSLEIGNRDEIVRPPQKYYDIAFERRLALLGKAKQNQGVLFVNFDGDTLSRGFGLNQSFILCSNTATIPAAGFDSAKRAEIIDRVSAFFQEKNIALTVTQSRPGSRPYTTMMVGGSMGDLGCNDTAGILGVAPLDNGNMNPDDVAFTFTKYYSNTRVVAETIAHEAGHSYGLDHIVESSGLMFYSNSPNITGFIDGTKENGGAQNAPQILLGLFGSGSGGGGSTSPSPPPTNPNFPPTNPGVNGIDLLANLLDALVNGQLGGALDWNALLNNLQNIFPGLSGIPLEQILSDLVGTLGNVLSREALGEVEATLQESGSEEFQKSLALERVASRAELINVMEQQADYATENFAPEKAEALISLLKIAYLNTYENLSK